MLSVTLVLDWTKHQEKLQLVNTIFVKKTVQEHLKSK